jgi:hypothetical protein
MLIQAIQTVLLLVGVALLGIMLYFVAANDVSSAHPAIEYKDFVSILLTSLGVMIAIAAVIAALAAIWGFSVLREEVRRAAMLTARKETRKIVPTLVSDQLEFERQGKETMADKIAEEYGKEAKDGRR